MTSEAKSAAPSPDPLADARAEILTALQGLPAGDTKVLTRELLDLHTALHRKTRAARLDLRGVARHVALRSLLRFEGICYCAQRGLATEASIRTIHRYHDILDRWLRAKIVGDFAVDVMSALERYGSEVETGLAATEARPEELRLFQDWLAPTVLFRICKPIRSSGA